MTIQELRNAPDNAEIKIINGELAIENNQSDAPKYKFKIGDKAILKRDIATAYLGSYVTSAIKSGALIEIINVWQDDVYIIEYHNETGVAEWSDLSPYPTKDITERIKKFADALAWCGCNNHDDLVTDYSNVGTDDARAYIKLRIITTALNEGWKPTFEKDEERWYPILNFVGGNCCKEWKNDVVKCPAQLVFKSRELAAYAAEQFNDYYLEYYGRQIPPKKHQTK